MDYSSNNAVPFEIPEVSHGFQKAKGLLKAGDKGINLEFEVTDAFIGIMKSGVKNVSIPYSELESIIFKRGWFSSKIILKGTSMRVFDEIPGTEVATCTLKVKRKDNEEAQNLISKARLHLSEYKLDQME